MSRTDREIPVCSSANRDCSLSPTDIRDNVNCSRDHRNVSVGTRGNWDVAVGSRDTRDIPAVHAPRPTSKSKSDPILVNATAVSYSNELPVASVNNKIAKPTENALKRNSTVEGQYIT